MFGSVKWAAVYDVAAPVEQGLGDPQIVTNKSLKSVKKHAAKTRRIESLSEQTIQLSSAEVKAASKQKRKRSKAGTGTIQPIHAAKVENSTGLNGSASQDGQHSSSTDFKASAPCMEPAQPPTTEKASKSSTKRKKYAQQSTAPPHSPMPYPTAGNDALGSTPVAMEQRQGVDETAGNANAAAQKQANDDAAVTAPIQGSSRGQLAKAGTQKLGKMQQQLSGGRFRMLNERLYTTDGHQALLQMQAEPALFDAYHRGFRAQVATWASNPVDLAIAWIRSKPRLQTIADFGCGDAQIAHELRSSHRVLSFDLVARNKHVQACTLSDVPCANGECDAVVLSLALMGRDYPTFLREAHRVLRLRGWLWIAEVRSRFVPAGAKQETFEPFLQCLQALGFKLARQDTSNKMFALFVLRKVAEHDSEQHQWPELKACSYKRR